MAQSVDLAERHPIFVVEVGVSLGQVVELHFDLLLLELRLVKISFEGQDFFLFDVFVVFKLALILIYFLLL